MQEMSVFDIIGPNMIGPSSSHTAGALKIALLAGRLIDGKIMKAEFTLYGSFAETYQGHGTDKALVAGILGFGTEDTRIKYSFEFAKKNGLEYRFVLNKTEKDVHPNTVDIKLYTQDNEITLVRGISIGGGNCKVEKINDIEVSLTGNYNTILVRQKDTFGVVAQITKVLSENQINIAFMRLYRENKGQLAYTIIEVDQPIPKAIAGKLKELPNIETVNIISI
ncbi:L-serine dehydratase [Mobilisporobacter senegalensis]|uniref:L-serine deaminase n=1 Tax=Mobilisporobacter senegalensis TaxID=1329262 RepID=A0A3N1XMX5_9FIRM|nr:L-serine ammonia-lyase, iron-sulfur-dependent subunit beta [Mobilisporobacter senegalensis]ROR27481.1 L-serine dehydratase [Mobilisporobacter senegalensis]